MASQEVPLAEVGKGQQQDSEAAPPGYYAASSPGPQQQQQQQQQQQEQQQQQPAISPNPAVPNPAHINNAPAAGQKVVYAGAPGAQPMGGAAFPVATPLNMLGSHPQPVDCPFCGVRTLTAVNQEASTMTHVTALLCCLLCVCLVFVPYAAHMSFNSEHRCGSCRKLLAVARDSGGVDVVAYPQAQPVNAQPPKEPQPTAQPQPQYQNPGQPQYQNPGQTQYQNPGQT